SRDVGQRDVVRDAKAEFACDGGDAFGTGAQSRVVEINVTALADGAVEIHGAVAAALPAVEIAPAERKIAGAVDVPIVGHARLLGGDADHGLESRSRRVGAGHGLVEERLLFVGVERSKGRGV